MSTTKIESICGITPKDFNKQEIIGSSYIFEVDPNFTPINLYNFWGDAATVNSFSECLHYVNGGFQPTITTIYDILIIVVFSSITLLSLYKFFSLNFHKKLISSLKKFFYDIKKINFHEKLNYTIFPFLIIQNYFVFDYVRTKAVRIPSFIDEYISLASNVSFFRNLDFNAGDFIGGSYSTLLTSGPISAIGGVIGWNLTSKFVIARISNFYWILFLQLFMSYIIVKIYKSEYKFLLFINSFILILIPWWQGSLYMIGEFASTILFVNGIYLFKRKRKIALLLFSLSIFFGKLLTLMPFVIFYFLSLIIEKKVKEIFSDVLFFSIPLFSWLILVEIKYQNGNILAYIKDLFYLILNHQSVGLETSSIISEVSSWNSYDNFRILIVPVLFLFLTMTNKSKIDEVFGKISIPLIGSILSTYVWFWFLSPTKWMRYSQHFTIVLIISLIYFLNFNIFNSKLDLFIASSSIASYIDNWKLLIFLFLIFSFYFLYIQSKINKNTAVKVLLVMFILIDLTIPYFQKDNFGNLHNIIDSCKKELVSNNCLEDYENN